MKKIIGIMGPSKVTEADVKNAYEIGKYCAAKGWVVLTGGRNCGVMNAGLQGAKDAGGLTVGVLFDNNEKNSEYIDIAIRPNIGEARNLINANSSDILVACGISAGTSTEVGFAVQSGKKVILVGLYDEANAFYRKMGKEQVFIAEGYKEACEIVDLHSN